MSTDSDSNEQIEVRCNREPGYFWADNEILDDYFIQIGPYSFAVYMLLGRWAMGKPSCDPSIPQISKALGLSESTIKKAIQKLVEVKLIKITRQQTFKDGKPYNSSNVYTLLKIKKKSKDLGFNTTHPGPPESPPLGRNKTQTGSPNSSDLGFNTTHPGSYYGPLLKEDQDKNIKEEEKEEDPRSSKLNEEPTTVDLAKIAKSSNNNLPGKIIKLDRVQIQEQRQFLEWSRDRLRITDNHKDDSYAVAWLIDQGCNLLTGIAIFEDLLASGMTYINWSRVKDAYGTHNARADGTQAKTSFQPKNKAEQTKQAIKNGFNKFRESLIKKG